MRIRRKNTRIALIVLLVLVIATVAAVGARYLKTRKSMYAVVTLDGVECGRFDLSEDRTLRLTPTDGSWYNILEIRDGQAAIIESDCENQICVNTPALVGEVFGVIVCLPHGLVVELSE